MKHDTDLAVLADRVEHETGCDNSLDVLVEIALFQPDGDWSAIRANAAGSKVICTRPNGAEKTFAALDWTMDRAGAAAALRGRLSNLLNEDRRHG